MTPEQLLRDVLERIPTLTGECLDDDLIPTLAEDSIDDAVRAVSAK
jgi:hypothetical protein